MVRSATFFGRVTSDPLGWTIAQETPAGAHIAVAGHTVLTEAGTQRLGSCYSGNVGFDATACAAFVGMRTSVVAAWVLLARRTELEIAGQKGRFEVDGMTVWKVKTSALVLSQGVQLAFGETFGAKLRNAESSARSLRPALENDGVGATIWVDAASGEVLDAGPNGCA